MIKHLAVGVLLTALPSMANANVVFKNVQDNGYFTPFNSSTPSNVSYGDGGWLTNWQPDGIEINQVTLGLATSGGTANGYCDLTFTLTDGDPSGLVFGSGAVLATVTVPNLYLIADETGHSFFDLTLPIPGVSTLGGFNNIGFSVSVSNFDFDGSFGFQCSSVYGQQVGYYTNNASYYNGSNWSLFSFGSGPYGVANFVAEIVPAPSAGVLLGAAGLAAAARRRRA
jgi:hypothetical protein